MKFKLSKYIVPSIISMVVVGTNANIDGFFIGRILGDDGLAAINIAWPIVAFIASLGTGIGVGGAVILNRVRGEGDGMRAECVKNTTLLLLAAAGILTGLLSYVLRTPLLVWMGAADAVLTHADTYAAVISAGAVTQILGAGLLVLLRNDEKTYQSMLYSLLGLVLHVVLDVLLAKHFVMAGVAMATVLSQLFITLGGFFSLRIDRSAGLARDAKTLGAILLSATAPLGINFVPSLVLLFTNTAALRAGGVAAVSAYAAMSYAVYTFDYIFQGVCDGIQPVVSYARGAGDKNEERRAVRAAAIILGALCVVCIALTLPLIGLLPVALGTSETAAAILSRGMWIYAVAYPAKVTVKLICSYYYSVGDSLLSNILVYLDPLVFTPLGLWLFTKTNGIDGVWMSMPFAQIAVVLCGVILIRFTRSKRACG